MNVMLIVLSSCIWYTFCCFAGSIWSTVELWLFTELLDDIREEGLDLDAEVMLLAF